jgi:hypothetical protein
LILARNYGLILLDKSHTFTGAFMDLTSGPDRYAVVVFPDERIRLVCGAVGARLIGKEQGEGNTIIFPSLGIVDPNQFPDMPGKIISIPHILLYSVDLYELPLRRASKIIDSGQKIIKQNKQPHLEMGNMRLSPGGYLVWDVEVSGLLASLRAIAGEWLGDLAVSFRSVKASDREKKNDVSGFYPNIIVANNVDSISEEFVHPNLRTGNISTLAIVKIGRHYTIDETLYYRHVKF